MSAVNGGVCTDTEGSYVCSCSGGYTGDGVTSCEGMTQVKKGLNHSKSYDPQAVNSKHSLVYSLFGQTHFSNVIFLLHSVGVDAGPLDLSFLVIFDVFCTMV